LANISISNLPFTKGSPDEILSFENNDMGIELFIEPLVEEYEMDIEKLLPKLSSKNLSFHCPYKFVNEAVPEDSCIWQKTLGAFKYTVNLCKKYNCSYLVVHTNESILDSTKGEKYAIKNLNTIINLTSKYDITAAVENVGIGFNCIKKEKIEEGISFLKKFI
jgi:endonuclease IV